MKVNFIIGATDKNVVDETDDTRNTKQGGFHYLGKIAGADATPYGRRMYSYIQSLMVIDDHVFG